MQTNTIVCATSSTVNVVGGKLTEMSKLNLFKKSWDQIVFSKNHYIKLNIDPKCRDQKGNSTFLPLITVIILV